MTVAEREVLRGRLKDLGFDEVRFVPCGEIGRERLRAWLDSGYHGSMAWLERNFEKRTDPALLQPGTRSLVLLGVNYFPGPVKQGGESPVWARYSLYSDYHDTIRPGLEMAGALLAETFGLGGDGYRYYVDTGPVLERAWAQRAGLGFVGKNAMLISRTSGNWLFLAAILVAAEIPADVQEETRLDGVGRHCGKCTCCLTACPTAALTAPGVVDARRCVSYLTIENKGAIPVEFRAALGDRIYGCDVCAEVCPWNRFAHEGRKVLLEARTDLASVSLRDLLRLDAVTYAALFKGTAVKRIKLQGVLRNACVVAGNSGDASLLPELCALCSHPLPLVRVHAVWAVGRLAGVSARERLATSRAGETDASVLSEYDALPAG